MKIFTIVGARPQFVKAAVVSRALKHHGHIEEHIIHTGQHFDQNMSDVFFDEMNIPKPSFNLNINGLSHGAMTGQMLASIEKLLIQEKPDKVMVYGDTNSTLAGALAASKLDIPVAHVEAGLRSFNMSMPEEINRILTDRISNQLFCPTSEAVKNLQNEGYGSMDIEIHQTGDVMYDAALYYSNLSDEKSKLKNELPDRFGLVTLHRQENTDNPEKLRFYIDQLNELNKSLALVCPLHPRTQKIIADLGLKVDFKVIEPVGYFDMIQLIKNAQIVVTDSGGLQKEAYFFQKYCVTLREQTEWVELVNEGVNYLFCNHSESLTEIAVQMMQQSFPKGSELYGQGTAGETIANLIIAS